MNASFGIMTLTSKLSHLKVKPAKRRLTKIRVRPRNFYVIHTLSDQNNNQFTIDDPSDLG